MINDDNFSGTVLIYDIHEVVIITPRTYFHHIFLFHVLYVKLFRDQPPVATHLPIMQESHGLLNHSL